MSQDVGCQRIFKVDMFTHGDLQRVSVEESVGPMYAVLWSNLPWVYSALRHLPHPP